MVWRSLGWAIVAIGTLLVLASAASAGTSFWAAPMVSGQTTYTFTNLDDVPNPVVVMTKQGEAHRTTVPAFSTATWTAQSSEAGLQNDALQIIAGGPMRVVGITHDGSRIAAAAIQSEALLGNEYWVLGLPGKVAQEDGSTLHIIAPATADVTVHAPFANQHLGLASAGAAQFQMAKFEHRALTTDDPTHDWTGARITSSVPIAVFYENTQSTEEIVLPRDIATAQLAANGGTEFAFCGTAAERNGYRGDRVRILATQPATTLNVRGDAPATHQLDAAGDWLELTLEKGALLTSTAPVHVLAEARPPGGAGGAVDVYIPRSTATQSTFLAMPTLPGVPDVTLSFQAAHAMNNAWTNQGFPANPGNDYAIRDLHTTHTCETYTSLNPPVELRVLGDQPAEALLLGTLQQAAFATNDIPFVPGTTPFPGGTTGTVTQTATGTIAPVCPNLSGAEQLTLEAGTSDFRTYHVTNGKGTLQATATSGVQWSFQPSTGRLDVQAGASTGNVGTVTVTMTPENSACAAIERSVAIQITPSTAACPRLDASMSRSEQLDAGIAWSRAILLTTTRPWTDITVSSGPEGLAFEPAHRRLRWEPTTAQEGTHTANVEIAFEACETLHLQLNLEVMPPLEEQHQNLACPAFLPGETSFEVTAGHALEVLLRTGSDDGMAFDLRSDQLPFGAILNARDGTLQWRTTADNLGSHGPIALELVAEEARCNTTREIHIHVVAPPPRCPQLIGHADIIHVVAGEPTQHTWRIEDPDNVGHVFEMLPPTRFRVSGPGLPPSEEPLRTGLDNITVTLEANRGDTGTFGGGFVKIRTGNEHCPVLERALALRVSLPETSTTEVPVPTTTPATADVPEPAASTPPPKATFAPETTAPTFNAESQDAPVPAFLAVLAIVSALLVRRRLRP